MTRIFLLMLACLGLCAPLFGAAGGHGAAENAPAFPLPETTYAELEEKEAAELGVDHLSLWQTLVLRAKADPINIVVTVLFFCAIVHTFLAGQFMKIAHDIERRHQYRVRDDKRKYVDDKLPVSFKATLFHFLGEVEAIFGIWVLPLFLIISFWPGHSGEDAVSYIDAQDYTEPVFVVIIMAIASSRPILFMARRNLSLIAGIGKRTPAAWWLSILTVAPILGSFVTEPAAMTIAALLLGQQFYKYNPSPRFAYATIGLLFVNISVGGTLTHFAAPPVLMVATGWGWGLEFMMSHFGWRAILGIILSNIVYLVIFRKDFIALTAQRDMLRQQEGETPEEEPVPTWVMLVHLGFIAWTVVTLHHPPLFVGGFLGFLAFTIATDHHQYQIQLRGPLLVGFFLAALKIHGGLQGWWISPVLGSFSEIPLFIGSTVLTAFNDNAAITYLASQVPDFSPFTLEGALKTGEAALRAETLEYAVVAGAVTGGGLTVIANAPNPAGQSILKRYFENGVSPLGLALGALIPTLIQAIGFMVLPH